MKTAILQVADTGPLESLVVMLRSIGYQCCIPNAKLLTELRSIFGKRGLVLSPEHLTRSMGYDPPMPLPLASIADMARSDVLYVDVKAHQIYHDVVRRWPNLTGKVLYYRIQGGKPEHVIRADGMDCGDEINPPCPVLTPNQWYKKQWVDDSNAYAAMAEVMDETPWDKFYVCWPPFHRFDDYRRNLNLTSGPPVCFIHNLHGWGYGKLAPSIAALGVKLFGNGSPDGLIPHSMIGSVLYNALAYVHLKSSDAPGYSLYEALASSCPVICTRRLIWRCRMQDLFIPNETCLVFDRETHEGLEHDDVLACTAEVRMHLENLKNPEYNRRIGQAGRERLREIMWSDKNEQDVFSLRQFMTRNFPTLEGA